MSRSWTPIETWIYNQSHTLSSTFHSTTLDIQDNHESINESGLLIRDLYIETLTRLASLSKSRLVFVETPCFDMLWIVPQLMGFQVECGENIRVDDTTLAVIICNPTNPNGTIRTVEELTTLSKKIKSKNSHLIIDAAFDTRSVAIEGATVISSFWKTYHKPKSAFYITVTKILKDFVIPDFIYENRYFAENIFGEAVTKSKTWFCLVNKNYFPPNMGVPGELFGADKNLMRISWSSRNFIKHYKSL